MFEIVRLPPAFLFRLGFAEPPKLLYDCHRQSFGLEVPLRSAALPGRRYCGMKENENLALSLSDIDFFSLGAYNETILKK